jgi:hypothetical protein
VGRQHRAAAGDEPRLGVPALPAPARTTSKFPDLRLRAVFPLLDLKRQLIASDRATLIGAANYILLIRKGSDAARPPRTRSPTSRQNYNFLAKLPVIISDHRLEIDVIAPKLDFVLKKDAYDVLDNRILARVLSTFVPPAARQPDPRHLLRRPGHLHPEPPAHDQADAGARARQGHRRPPQERRDVRLQALPGVHPAHRAVGTNQALLQALLALRTQREISRDTILEYMGLDEATEAQRLESRRRSTTTSSRPRSRSPRPAPEAEGHQRARPVRTATRPVTYASVDAPALPAARQAPGRVARQAPASPPADPRVHPHMTLAYDDRRDVRSRRWPCVRRRRRRLRRQPHHHPPGVHAAANAQVHDPRAAARAVNFYRHRPAHVR